MGKKLSTKERAAAMDWFRKNQLPLLETADAKVRFTVDEELDDDGNVQFQTVIMKPAKVVYPPERSN